MARFSILLMALLAVLSNAAHAHKLKVFAFAEGGRIEGTTYFVGGTPASGATVEVMGANDRLLATLVPDTAGDFSYEVDTHENHMIVANTGDGHVARWTVSAAEFTGQTSGSTEQNAYAAPSSGTADSATEPDNGELVTLVEQAVARQIQPLREQIIRNEERVRLQDIVGGIGYIMGIYGVAIWWQQRRRSGS